MQTNAMVVWFSGAYGLDIGTNIALLLRRVADALPEHAGPPSVMCEADGPAQA